MNALTVLVSGDMRNCNRIRRSRVPDWCSHIHLVLRQADSRRVDHFSPPSWHPERRLFTTEKPVPAVCRYSWAVSLSVLLDGCCALHGQH